MPYDDSPPSPESASSVSTERRWFARRSGLAVGAAVLAPTALAGWVLVQVTTGAGADDARPPRIVMPAASPTDAAAATPSSAPAEGPAKSPAAAPAKGPLAGKTVVIDPGHNTGNFKHTSEIDKKVDIGTNRKECDTTGTTTNSGYMEAEFTLDVSRRLRTVLEAKGLKVVLTHQADRPFGPCIDERARIGNEAAADAVVSVHADGVSEGNRGYHIILPAKVKGGAADTAKIVGPSRDLGERIASNFARTTGSAPANYLGSGTGLVVRDDLGGLNLSTQPKVFIECGNMRDAKDAALLTSPEWRQKAAQGIADGIVGFLGG
ncbi:MULTISPECIES: N-acetylmuramoyl-L-alanine amidase [unclassified Streptomyces]|uniref:N-acetylmuramoyl-L-alanine amidase n=1 Tax=Streptomyces sp. R33 TaxID=3238629 RepID=A0AB39Y8N8_9ACTN|nr:MULTISPECIES: N-acetylmuramoyl-L-alanine amidase [unclassified Streptomyces]KOY59246.1 N-acetylmuramoyl-L-alanine amidase [Streptomyces sp. XY332]TDU78442.1 N-acetylmuramoyl-L-alanine amidase [Streptomyces sp. KS 21]THA32229.1 N-acetylmuramoyl-L-alanine amidase [Streptomyces sp. A1547]